MSKKVFTWAIDTSMVREHRALEIFSNILSLFGSEYSKGFEKAITHKYTFLEILFQDAWKFSPKQTAPNILDRGITEMYIPREWISTNLRNAYKTYCYSPEFSHTRLSWWCCDNQKVIILLEIKERSPLLKMSEEIEKISRAFRK